MSQFEVRRPTFGSGFDGKVNLL